jgi:hypothetical protein
VPRNDAGGAQPRPVGGPDRATRKRQSRQHQKQVKILSGISSGGAPCVSASSKAPAGHAAVGRSRPAFIGHRNYPFVVVRRYRVQARPKDGGDEQGFGAKQQQGRTRARSERVDLLIVSRSGDPIAAIEYQGHGHYQGTAAARDAVKKEALRKAGVGYIAVTPESGTEDMAREISRIAQAERLSTDTSLRDGDRETPSKERGTLRAWIRSRRA